MKAVAGKPKPAFAGEEGLFDLFAERAFTVRVLLVACLFFMLTSAVGPVLTLYLAHEPERVAIVADDATVTIARLQRSEEALAFPRIAAAEAARAMLDRSPSGVDDPDTIGLMFNRTGKEKLKELVKGEEATFREFGYHQKAEIKTTEIAAETDGGYRVTLKGQVIRAGVFNQAPKLDTLGFTLILYLFRNETAVVNRQYPLGIWNFDYKESR